MDRFLWLKSVIFNPVKPICDDINHKAHKGHKARTEGFSGYQELVYLCESSVIFVHFVVKIRNL